MTFAIMFRLSTLYLAFTIALVSVPEARSQTTVPIPPCVQACIQGAAGASGCSPTDPNCACFSDTFINTVADCIAAQCTAAEVQAAQQIFRQFCSGSLRRSHFAPRHIIAQRKNTF
ncbi:hypothetical protein BC826DRAFT_663504 [Russula brevipes]|nr:hypothetical protein BC826DRAFT_663504 [Russula brevipes]